MLNVLIRKLCKKSNNKITFRLKNSKGIQNINQESSTKVGFHFLSLLQEIALINIRSKLDFFYMYIYIQYEKFLQN